MRCNLSSFQKSSWTEYMKEVQTEGQPLPLQLPLENIKYPVCMVTCRQANLHCCQRENCSTELQYFNWLKYFNYLSKQWVQIKPLSAFQLLAVLILCNTVMSSLFFSFFPYLCSRTNPGFVLMQKSLNVLKPYTKPTKSQSRSEGQPKSFVPETS